jgi:hypothetical protein
LDEIVDNDGAEILDEFIWRIALGIDVAVTHNADEEHENPSQHTTYLGLSVHGKTWWTRTIQMPRRTEGCSSQRS